jgi:peroxiredoxin
MDDSTEKAPLKPPDRGRSPFWLVGGAVLIGLALALLLFGGDWWGDGGVRYGGETAVLPQLSAQTDGARVAELPPPSSANWLAVGDTAYNFFLPDLDGNVIDLESFRGRPVIINFWATWCAPCRQEMPDLQAVYEERQGDELVILAVNSQESYQEVADFFAELELTFTPLLDYEGEIVNLYNVFNFPTTYFVDAEGQITAVHRGQLSEEQIEAYLDATIPAQP